MNQTVFLIFDIIQFLIDNCPVKKGLF